ncbi:hypothetical protein MC7420_2569 [Coleofasciculus chthonoplastes PCC 7420]|uniref:Uncharacterized protein n=2 Tax=Coleofasciculus chthonoplastes TaxID=64178 RepID=B4VYK6_9CYAN|nr:hypothetical protein MC7420_2569 [Coleofasciculus chthonoplastes PCC 7420]
MNRLSKIAWTGAILGSMAGLVWVVNLPYPMIRRPVARTAPILLLPSYIQMDHNYRQTIRNVEQADQLINNSTSAADFSLGEEKVKLAQTHLDKLPIWFLGYEPKFYCNLFSCSWKFTLDEFESARTNVARMEAKVFQEKNAQIELKKAETALNQAKQQYQQAATLTDKQNAIASWQTALDHIEQIPSATLAGQTAKTKLIGYQRDFQQVVGFAADNQRTGSLIGAAQEFAFAAAQAAQNPPHTVAEWQQIQKLWQQAIARLEQIPLEDQGYLEAQKLLATYQTNLGVIQTRSSAEAESMQALEEAQRQIQRLLANTPTDATIDRNLTISQLQGIINQLNKVQSGTTSYSKAQELLRSAQTKLQQLQP